MGFYCLKWSLRAQAAGLVARRQEESGEEKHPKALCKLNKIQAEGESQHCDYLELENELRIKLEL